MHLTIYNIMPLHYRDRLHDNIARYLGNRFYCAVHLFTLYKGDISNIPMCYLGNNVMYIVNEQYSNVATLIDSIYCISLYLHR